MTEAEKQQIINNQVENTLTVYFVDGTDAITEHNIASESMTLTQSICDESRLKFGGCIASEFSIDVINTADRAFVLNDLVGKEIYAVLTTKYVSTSLVYPSSALYPSSSLAPGNKIESVDFVIFRGTIKSAKLDQNNQNKRHVVAYDAFADLYDLDFTNYLYSQWNNVGISSHTLCTLLIGLNDFIRDYYTVLVNSHGFLKINNKTQTYTVVNSKWLGTDDEITAGQALNYIYETIGCFGYLEYSSEKYLTVEAVDLQNTETEIYDTYINLYSEEFTSEGYQYARFSNNVDDKNSKTVDVDYNTELTSGKVYDFSDNIFLYQKTDITKPSSGTDQVSIIMNGGTTDKLTNCDYIPFTATVIGRPWNIAGHKLKIKQFKTDVNGEYLLDENGDKVVTYFESYILSRTLSGIKSLTDKITTKGAN